MKKQWSKILLPAVSAQLLILITIDDTSCLINDDVLFLLPTPQKINFRDDGVLVLASPIICSSNGSRIQSAVTRWLQTSRIGGRLFDHDACNLRFQNETKVAFLQMSEDSMRSSEYWLFIDSNGVKISARDEEGLFHGLMTLKQIILQSPEMNEASRSVADRFVYNI